MKLYNILLLISIIIVIYILLLISKIDDIDKKAIYYFLKNSNKFNVEASFYTYIKFIYKTLLIPFKEKIYLEKFTEGGIYSSYIYEFHSHLGYIMNDKLYWNDIFNKYYIDHPDIICFKKNNKLILNKNIDDNKIYIKKPINGALGYNVDIINGKDIINYSKYNNNFLVQEKLNDCLYGKARHFRIVTLYNGDIFSTWVMKQNDKNKIASNEGNGGVVIDCNNLNCSLSILEKTKLENMIKKLQDLHKNIYNNILSIGWDVMFDCVNKKDVKCYCLEGNICALVWPPNIKDNNVIYNYKKIVKEFYNKNNI